MCLDVRCVGAFFIADHGKRVRPRYEDESVTHGLHADKVFPRGEKGTRCSKCGFICNTERDQYGIDGSKLGEGRADDNVDESWGESWGEIPWGGVHYDFVINKGCPFCGTYLYR